MSERTRKATQTGQVLLKELLKEPIREAVQEGMAEHEKRLHSEQVHGHVEEESTDDGGRRLFRPRMLLGLAVLAGLTLYARQRSKSMMDSWKVEDSTRDIERGGTSVSGGGRDTSTGGSDLGTSTDSPGADIESQE